MRSVLVTFLIVLYHAAQLPCRSLTRGAPLYPPTPSSQEDLEAIIARNQEITDLLLPLLEANLGAKKLDQNKRNDLLKVFPYRNKDPVVEFLPFAKRKSRDRKTPLALILASELRSRKGKKGSKVHAQKAFLIHNDDKISTEEDYDAEINQEPAPNDNYDKMNTEEDLENNNKTKVVEIKRTAENIDFSGSDEGYVIGPKRKHKEHPDLNENTVEVNESEEFYDIDIRRKPKEKIKVKKIYISKETQEDSGEDDGEKVQKKNNRKFYRDYSNVKIVKSDSSKYDDVQSSEDSNDFESKYHKNVVKDDEFDSQSAEQSKYHKTSSERSHNDSVNSKEDNIELKQIDNSSEIKSFKVSREHEVIDLSKEHAKHSKHTKNLEHHQKHRNDKSSLEEDYKDESDEKYKAEEKYKSHENFESAIRNDEEKNSMPPSDGAVKNMSDENKTSEDQDEKEIENEYYDHNTNENNISEPDEYVNDNLDVSDNHENVEHGSHEELYDEDVENISKEENDKASYEDVRDEENDHYTDVEYDNRSEEDYGGTDTEYVDTENDFKVRTPEETSEDDIPTVDDDLYTDESIDNSANDNISFETRKASNEDDSKKNVTFSQEIADEYAEDSHYTVEDDHFLVESSGELAKFKADSDEGLIEVLRQEDEENKCKEKDIKVKPGKVHLDDHSYEVNKSYKLSFKFNK